MASDASEFTATICEVHTGYASASVTAEDTTAAETATA